MSTRSCTNLPALAAAALLVVAAGCAASPENRDTAATTSPSDTGPGVYLAGEEHRIRELDRRWVELVAARDARAIAGFYAPNGRLMMPNAPEVSGAADVQRAWEQIFALPDLTMTFEPTEIRVDPGGRMAYDVGRYQLSYTGPDGQRVEDRGKYLIVWEKHNEQWKVAADMFNSNLER